MLHLGLIPGGRKEPGYETEGIRFNTDQVQTETELDLTPIKPDESAIIVVLFIVVQDEDLLLPIENVSV